MRLFWRKFLKIHKMTTFVSSPQAQNWEVIFPKIRFFVIKMMSNGVGVPKIAIRVKITKTFSELPSRWGPKRLEMSRVPQKFKGKIISHWTISYKWRRYPITGPTVLDFWAFGHFNTIKNSHSWIILSDFINLGTTCISSIFRIIWHFLTFLRNLQKLGPIFPKNGFLLHFY